MSVILVCNPIKNVIEAYGRCCSLYLEQDYVILPTGKLTYARVYAILILTIYGWRGSLCS